jgi:hypothetical protein
MGILRCAACSTKGIIKSFMVTAKNLFPLQTKTVLSYQIGYRCTLTHVPQFRWQCL